MSKSSKSLGWLAIGVGSLVVSCGDGLGGFLISDAQEVEMGAGVDTQLRTEYRLAATSDPAAQ